MITQCLPPENNPFHLYHQHEWNWGVKSMIWGKSSGQNGTMYPSPKHLWVMIFPHLKMMNSRGGGCFVLNSIWKNELGFRIRKILVYYFKNSSGLCHPIMWLDADLHPFNSTHPECPLSQGGVFKSTITLSTILTARSMTMQDILKGLKN